MFGETRGPLNHLPCRPLPLGQQTPLLWAESYHRPDRNSRSRIASPQGKPPRLPAPASYARSPWTWTALPIAGGGEREGMPASPVVRKLAKMSGVAPRASWGCEAPVPALGLRQHRPYPLSSWRTSQTRRRVAS